MRSSVCSCTSRFSLILIGGMLLSISLCRAQGEFNNWYFGEKAGISFNSGTPAPLVNGQMAAVRSSITVSDSLGNLLFYSDGRNVWNKNHAVMPNAVWLNTTACDQNVAVVRKIDDDSSYYMFTMKMVNYPVVSTGGVHYSVINMRLNGGLGDIEPGQKEIQLQASDAYPSQMVTVRHGNNRDAWLVVRNAYTSNTFASYLITSSGISATPVLSPVNWQVLNQIYCNPGTMRISPDGTKLVYPTVDTVGFYSFDAFTGYLTPLFLFTTGDPFSAYAWHYMEFSRDSRYLYCSTGDWPNSPSQIYQFDASLTDSAHFKHSEILLGTLNRGVHFERGPDGKIYGAESGLDSICIIHNPELPGLACNFQPHAMSLQGRQCNMGLPDQPQRYYLYIMTNGRCIGDTIHFTPVTWPPADSIHWDFGDPLSGIANTSLLPQAGHVYNTPGIYTVHLFVRHNDKRTDTASVTVSINEGVDISAGPDKSICEGDSAILTAGGCPGCNFTWSDLTTGVPNVGSGAVFTTHTAGIFTVSGSGASGCTDTDTVQVFLLPLPVISNGTLTKNICSGDSTRLVLESFPAGASFTWTATLAEGTITGYSNGSGPVINQSLTNSLQTPGKVIYHVIPSAGECIGNVTDFEVTVLPVDTVKVSISASANPVCDGTTVVFTATATHAGNNPSYLWTVNDLPISASTSSTFSYMPSDGDQVRCILHSSLTGCLMGNPDTSQSIGMSVSLPDTVSISVTSSAATVCPGTMVLFTANAVHAGSAPLYQWSVNGINIGGATGSSYSIIPQPGDLVRCQVTATGPCVANNPAVSPPVTVQILPGLPVSITISASVNPFCPGDPVTFSATGSNTGTSPLYQWVINSVNVPSATNPVFTYVPQPGDEVSCRLTSSASCATGNPAFSDVILMSSLPNPEVTFTACFDTVTTLEAKPFRLKGGLPLNGIYSGPGISAGFFSPSGAGLGIKTITYSYTNTAGCKASANVMIQIVSSTPFTCGSELIDIRNGKSYPTVQVGTQCWMAANLDFGLTVDHQIPQSDNCEDEQYTHHPSPFSRQSFYQWNELMRYDSSPGAQGLCAPGWHVPTAEEWVVMATHLQGPGVAGKYLQDPMMSGFGALPAGILYQNTLWSFTGSAMMFWTSTPDGDSRALARGMHVTNYSVSLYAASRAEAMSVRCVRDGNE